MTYNPVRIITVTGRQLSESSDLTVQIGSLATGKNYLLLEKNGYYWTVSINAILLWESGISLTDPVSSALTAKLDDIFVQKYTDMSVPYKTSKGNYLKKLDVFNPISNKGWTVSYGTTENAAIRNEEGLKGSLDDLILTSDLDMTNMLVAVNGVFHRTTLYNGEIYVHDGFRTIRLTDRKDVTVMDTTGIGGHTVVPLTSSNSSHGTYNGVCRVTVPGGVQNKTVLLVVDGFLYHLDTEVLKYLSNTVIGIKTDKLPLIQQFRHNPRTLQRRDILKDSLEQGSSRYVDDYAKLFLTDSGVVPTAPLNTLDFQTSRLFHYHSFLIVINNPSIYMTTKHVDSIDVRGMYFDFSDKPLSGAVELGCGLCPSYLIHKEDGGRRQVLISTQDHDTDDYRLTVNPLYLTKLYDDLQPVSSNVRARFVDYVSA